jgi:uncharacterized protein
MEIRHIIWLESILDKIQSKHQVSLEEVEWVLEHRPHVRFCKKGNVKGEDVFSALGRTSAGRYLIIFFILKQGKKVLPISARQMTSQEKRLYGRQKKRKT